jgi:hypothetical protein
MAKLAHSAKKTGITEYAENLTSLIDEWSKYWMSTMQNLFQNPPQEGEIRYNARVALNQLEFVLRKSLPFGQAEHSEETTRPDRMEEPLLP